MKNKAQTRTVLESVAVFGRASGHRIMPSLAPGIAAADAPGALQCAAHGSLAAGRPANLVVFDPEREWVVGDGGFVSKSSNTPLAGARVRGKVRHTLLRGTPTCIEGRVAGEVTV